MRPIKLITIMILSQAAVGMNSLMPNRTNENPSKSSVTAKPRKYQRYITAKEDSEKIAIPAVFSSENTMSRWRKWMLGARNQEGTSPDDHLLVWTRNDGIGVGNALSGLGHAVFFSLAEDRSMVIRSVIIDKLCRFVTCTTQRLSNYSIFLGQAVDVAHKDFALINFGLDEGIQGNDYTRLSAYCEVTGCSNLPPWDPGDSTWPLRCLYSRILNSLIVGPTRVLANESKWLRSFYNGDYSRFEDALRVNRKSGECIFDAVVHLRTLQLIEDHPDEKTA